MLTINNKASPIREAFFVVAFLSADSQEKQRTVYKPHASIFPFTRTEPLTSMSNNKKATQMSSPLVKLCVFVFRSWSFVQNCDHQYS